MLRSNAAGAGTAAVRALRSDVADVAFVAMRPPGHHAERGRAMGFCLFNNVAVTAAELSRADERIAIVDWDVHHGNGSQQLFAAESEVLYVSLHQHPFYPGTGMAGEIGEGAGKGTTVNLPMSAGAGGPIYAEAFARVVIPVIRQARAGLDAGERRLRRPPERSPCRDRPGRGGLWLDGGGIECPDSQAAYGVLPGGGLQPRRIEWIDFKHTRRSRRSGRHRNAAHRSRGPESCF